MESIQAISPLIGDLVQTESDIEIIVEPSAPIRPHSMPLPLFASSSTTITRVRSYKPVRCDRLLVFVWADALDAVLAHGQSDRVNEVGGWLLGQYGSDGTHRFVLIEASVPARGGSKSPGGFSFTCEDQEELADLKEKQYSNLLIVGWYHSHPMGMRLSGVDERTHRTVFNEPFHIAMVMSTGGRDIGCAVWDDGKISDVGGFFVLEKGSQ